MSSKKDMWSHYLDTCAFAYNTSQHDSTKYTPFMLMFGRQATLPIDVELEWQCSEDLCKTYCRPGAHGAAGAALAAPTMDPKIWACLICGLSRATSSYYSLYAKQNHVTR